MKKSSRNTFIPQALQDQIKHGLTTLTLTENQPIQCQLKAGVAGLHSEREYQNSQNGSPEWYMTTSGAAAIVAVAQYPGSVSDLQAALAADMASYSKLASENWLGQTIKRQTSFFGLYAGSYDKQKESGSYSTSGLHMGDWVEIDFKLLTHAIRYGYGVWGIDWSRDPVPFRDPRRVTITDAEYEILKEKPGVLQITVDTGGQDKP